LLTDLVKSQYFIFIDKNILFILDPDNLPQCGSKIDKFITAVAMSIQASDTVY